MCQKWHHMITTHERNNFLRAKHDTLHCLMSRWLAKHPPYPSKIATRLPSNTQKLTLYEPAKLLPEQVIHLSVIKSYQLEFHHYSWHVYKFKLLNFFLFLFFCNNVIFFGKKYQIMNLCCHYWEVSCNIPCRMWLVCDRASFWLQEYMMTAGLLCCSSQSEVLNYHSVSEGNPSHNLTDNLFRGNMSTWLGSKIIF